MRTGRKNKNGGKPRFGKVVGDPRDVRGLFCAMRRFIEHRATLGATDSGQYNQERYIREFIGWADVRSITHPEQVSQAVLERYQRWLYHYRKKDGEPLSNASQRTKLVPLRAFFKWLTRSGQIPANPAAELDLPRKLRRLPRGVMSVDEVEQVLGGADTGSVLGLRDRAMMEVLYSTGMRRMEIARLALADVDMIKGVVSIREGKGRKDRIVPIGERAVHWVRQYLERSREQLLWDQQEQTLFLGNEGLPLSPVWLSTVVSRYVVKAIGRNGGCHLFRHTMATLMLEGGADIRFIQAMLGHAELSTTQIYTHVAIRQLQLVHERTHPGARRRVSGAQGAAEAEGGTAEENAATALFNALDAESDEEGEPS
jgi:integrase/recombinase XerD